MKFGLALSVQHPPRDPQVSRFGDHHYLSAPFTYFQPIPVLARVAAEARGMTLGIGCLVLPLHHPLEVAEQVATLDVIAEGRLIFGVALGYRDAENQAMGHSPRDRAGRLEEGLRVIEALWNGEPVSFRGRHFTLTDVRISVTPIQRPRQASRGATPSRSWRATGSSSGAPRTCETRSLATATG